MGCEFLFITRETKHGIINSKYFLGMRGICENHKTKKPSLVKMKAL